MTLSVTFSNSAFNIDMPDCGSVICVTDASNLSEHDKKWIWNLLETNMKPVYGASWKKEAKEKKAEMTSEDSKYLIARAVDMVGETNQENVDPDEPLGFLHYKFVIEEGVVVLYVYELQIAEAAQRRGVGKFLMMLVEALARKAGVSGVMLTVQTANPSAQKFYESAKYAVSPISPRKCDPWAFEENQYDYDIYQKIWNDESAKVLTEEGQKCWRENKEMFDTASVFVHSNDEIKDAFKNATISA